MSWEGDAQLVRSKTSTGFNMAVGEPFFLRQVFANYYPESYSCDLGYPDNKPDPLLKAELENLHPNKHIVVALGAKHALHAAIYAIRQMRQVERLYHRAPYWPTYPTLAKYAGLEFQTSLVDPSRTIVCNTSPNNPDGSECLDPCDIWDAAYAHPSYGWTGREPQHLISVWSAGKMLGSTGVRVGWLVTEHPKLAEFAARYVEQTTSGVPSISQDHVAETLSRTADFRTELSSEAYSYLYLNSDVFWHNLSGFVRPLMETHSGSMFAWFEPVHYSRFSNALKSTSILMVQGLACGGPANAYRASLGLLHEDLVTAMDQLRKELSK